MFTYYGELKSAYQKGGDQIFYQLINKVYDSSEQQIMEQFP